VIKMNESFHLEILTPERQFYRGEIEALVVTTVDGEFTILKDHTAITLPLVVGSIKLKRHDKWNEAFQSEGFFEVNNNIARVFVQTCEWPEDIDRARAIAAEKRALDRMRRVQSMIEYQWTKIALTRAMVRLRITRGKRTSN